MNSDCTYYKDCLKIEKGNIFIGSLMFDNVDSFVTLSRENSRVTYVGVVPFDGDARDYEFWDKVGQGVGNLERLMTLDIYLDPHVDDGDEVLTPDWEILARILPYLRHKVALRITGDVYVEVEDIEELARVIHGHRQISAFSSEICLTFANLGPWWSALATLPSLESVVLGLQELDVEEQHDLLNPEPLTELLRAPNLRFVRFDAFDFTDALCRATATALAEGSSIVDITFDNECSFPSGGSAIIANALKRNATITNVEFRGGCDEPFCNTLAAVLLCNSTVHNLTLAVWEGASGRWISSIFLSLGMNTTLKRFVIDINDRFGDQLCAAITSGLAKNSTLEELSICGIIPTDNDGAKLARNALSFIRTNTTLKSLTLSFHPVGEESYASAFRLEAVKMMEENSFLESLTIETEAIGFEEFLDLISSLQLNATLKTVGFQSDPFYSLTDNEVNQLVPILMKNYGLERLVPDIGCPVDRAVKAIFRLNGAGRRYLIEDGSSISKGVEVLCAVSDEIDCVFLHLLENAGLCNRRAVDATTSQQPGTNVDESSGSGKRERTQSQLATKKPRRRLT